HQGFGDALAFIVTGAGPDGIDVAPVALGLRMHRGVAIHLGGRCLKNPGSEALGQHQHIHGAHHVRFDGLDRIVLIVNRRSRAGQVVNLVYVDEERLGHIVAERLELLVLEQVLDILPATGEEVIQAYDVVALCQEAFAEVGADEAGAAGHKDAHGYALVEGGGRPLTTMAHLRDLGRASSIPLKAPCHQRIVPAVTRSGRHVVSRGCYSWSMRSSGGTAHRTVKTLAQLTCQSSGWLDTAPRLAYALTRHRRVAEWTRPPLEIKLCGSMATGAAGA